MKHEMNINHENDNNYSRHNVRLQSRTEPQLDSFQDHSTLSSSSLNNHDQILNQPNSNDIIFDLPPSPPTLIINSQQSLQEQPYNGVIVYSSIVANNNNKINRVSNKEQKDENIPLLICSTIDKDEQQQQKQLLTKKDLNYKVESNLINNNNFESEKEFVAISVLSELSSSSPTSTALDLSIRGAPLLASNEQPQSNVIITTISNSSTKQSYSDTIPDWALVPGPSGLKNNSNEIKSPSTKITLPTSSLLSSTNASTQTMNTNYAEEFARIPSPFLQQNDDSDVEFVGDFGQNISNPKARRRSQNNNNSDDDNNDHEDDCMIVFEAKRSKVSKNKQNKNVRTHRDLHPQRNNQSTHYYQPIEIEEIIDVLEDDDTRNNNDNNTDNSLITIHHSQNRNIDNNVDVILDNDNSTSVSNIYNFAKSLLQGEINGAISGPPRGLQQFDSFTLTTPSSVSASTSTSSYLPAQSHQYHHLSPPSSLTPTFHVPFSSSYNHGTSNHLINYGLSGYFPPISSASSSSSTLLLPQLQTPPLPPKSPQYHIVEKVIEKRVEIHKESRSVGLACAICYDAHPDPVTGLCMLDRTNSPAAPRDENPDDPKFWSLRCGHVYCGGCLDMIFSQTPKQCAICRKRFTKNSPHRIYMGSFIYQLPNVPVTVSSPSPSTSLNVGNVFDSSSIATSTIINSTNSTATITATSAISFSDINTTTTS